MDKLLSSIWKSYPLKNLYRQGWLRHVERQRCESVADHSFFTALLSWWLSALYFPELDASRVIKMALLHDLPEACAGDATPADGVSAAEKQARERRGLNEIIAGLPNGEELAALWEEFEAGESAEAQFVRQIDKLEMAIQACLYEHQEGADLDEFFRSAAEAVNTPELQKLLNSLPRKASE